jgi:hypothetical protein
VRRGLRFRSTDGGGVGWSNSVSRRRGTLSWIAWTGNASLPAHPRLPPAGDRPLLEERLPPGYNRSSDRPGFMPNRLQASSILPTVQRSSIVCH